MDGRTEQNICAGKMKHTSARKQQMLSSFNMILCLATLTYNKNKTNNLHFIKEISFTMPAVERLQKLQKNG